MGFDGLMGPWDLDSNHPARRQPVIASVGRELKQDRENDGRTCSIPCSPGLILRCIDRRLCTALSMCMYGTTLSRFLAGIAQVRV